MRWRIAFMLAAGVLEMAQAPYPMPGTGDAHIQYLAYRPDQVVPLQATPGFALVIELADDERAENVIVGSTANWSVSANKRGDRVIVKPSAGAPTTDLVISTDVRRYVFLLSVSETAGNAPFVVHFSYPGQAVTTAAPPASIAATYKLEGDKNLFPAAISDDGDRTSVTWGKATPLPAIYAVDRSGHEALINGRMVGNDFVIQGVARRYIFRLGKARAVAERRPLLEAGH